MVASDDSWCSLTCTPLPGLELRAQLEDLLYSAGCGGIWEHAFDGCRELGCPEDFATPFLTAYFPHVLGSLLPSLAHQLENMKLISGIPEIENVKNEDWLDGWRNNFTLTELTEKTLIVPSWLELPVGETRLGIKIYPGQGFGTGTHETTRIAATVLEEELSAFDSTARVLDVGTGSGILAILAAKRGAARVLALDIDDEALANAKENCAHNQICDQLSLENRTLTQIEEKFTLIVANIIAPVLITLAPDFSKLLKPEGRLILSGILFDQVDQVKKVFTETGFEVKPTITLGEWAGLVCKLK